MRPEHPQIWVCKGSWNQLSVIRWLHFDVIHYMTHHFDDINSQRSCHFTWSALDSADSTLFIYLFKFKKKILFPQYIIFLFLLYSLVTQLHIHVQLPFVNSYPLPFASGWSSVHLCLILSPVLLSLLPWPNGPQDSALDPGPFALRFPKEIFFMTMISLPTWSLSTVSCV